MRRKIKKQQKIGRKLAGKKKTRHRKFEAQTASRDRYQYIYLLQTPLAVSGGRGGGGGDWTISGARENNTLK
jgi:hypothetical protein